MFADKNLLLYLLPVVLATFFGDVFLFLGAENKDEVLILDTYLIGLIHTHYTL